MASEFADAHARLFGFGFEGRALIVESIEVEAESTLASPLVGEAVRGTHAARTEGGRTRFFSQGEWHDATVRRTDELETGDALAGPALLIEPQPDHRCRTGMARGNHARARCHSVARNHAGIGATHNDRCRSRSAGSLRQSFHGHRRGNGRHAAKHRDLREHQGAARFFLRHLRCGRRPCRQRAAHAGASGFDGRLRDRDHAKARRGHCARATSSSPTRPMMAARICRTSPWWRPCSSTARAVSSSLRAGTMPTSAASRRARCRPSRATSPKKARLFDGIRMVRGGHFDEAAHARTCLKAGEYPARNPEQNIADLKAQAAACAKGAEELKRAAQLHGVETLNGLYAPCAGQCGGIRAPRDRRVEGRRIRHADGWRHGNPREGHGRSQEQTRRARRLHRHERASSRTISTRRVRSPRRRCFMSSAA